MKVRFMVLGGGTREVDVPSGTTVQEAAEKAELDLGGMSLKISDSDVVQPTDKLQGRDNVLLTAAPKVEGGRS